MNYIKLTLGIFTVLAVSRFIPHPPNFTSLIALSFYVPAIFGKRSIPIVLISFLITDLFIGFHNTLFFTWGSVLFISLLSRFFLRSVLSRVSGALFGAVIFFIITNFGVWSLGNYGFTSNGLITTYILAIPFFGNTFLSTIIYSLLIECLIKYKFLNNSYNLSLK